MKRIILFLLISFLLFSLGCVEPKNQTSAEPGATPSIEQLLYQESANTSTSITATPAEIPPPPVITPLWGTPITDNLTHLPSVYISSVQFDAPGDDRNNLNGEWVKITNSDSISVVMTGWELSEARDKYAYIFPEFTLSPGATVTIFTGSGTNTTTELYINRDMPIWSNDGDIATLRDASGNVIDQKISR